MTAAASDWPPADEIGEILFSADEIQRRVTELGREITEATGGEPLLLVAILKGSIPFAADLMRAIEGPVEIDYMAVSSYGDETKSSGIVRILKDLDTTVHDKHVIVVEDIIDSGLTMAYLVDHLQKQEPASLRTVSLLVREGKTHPDVQVDHVGFEIPGPAFVIGYGLDLAQRFRNLPYVAYYAKG
ncbi:MAG: hypoxanthine phosphoribosyltransferase [Acidimicrobiales bacterium]